ncbi:MAG: hypothetical protein HYX87_09090 [Chloroflexi bacterium]|nr:hypothetical protein [Chloroflexota bacterium]
MLGQHEYKYHYIESDTWAPIGQEEAGWLSNYIAGEEERLKAGEFVTRAEFEAFKRKITR